MSGVEVAGSELNFASSYISIEKDTDFYFLAFILVKNGNNE